jgi:sugar phosphate isomerase/epimerase
MKFGYMSGFRADLVSEIEFAKQYFDFTEITIQPALLQSIDNILLDLKNSLGEFEVVGHVHWEILALDEIIKNIEVLKSLGAKKVTIHPFQNLSIEENIKIFTEIDIFMQKNEMQLLIENVSSAPFNVASDIEKLVEKIPNAKITLDIGHANINNELDKFIAILKSKIEHIHLHDNVGKADHLFFSDKNKLNDVISEIKSLGYDDTILLETFSIMQDNKNISQEFAEIKELHLGQLKMINTNNLME